ncbi:hypothetical protein FJZ26_04890 [Candidatus Parvarchaeota archaeon]|nr:hypothetical protein [Candidatus Parvarchaeota archaeon]
MALVGELSQSLVHKGSGNKVSSIGAKWPPGFDANNRRLKGIYLSPIETQGQLGSLFTQVSKIERSNGQSTRTTFRAFLPESLAESIRQDSGSTYPVEAVIKAGNAVPGHSLVYFGKNKPSRVPSQDLRAAEQESLNTIVQNVRPVGESRAIARATEGGYSLEVFDPALGNGDIKSMLELYAEAYQVYTFPITQQTISSMVSNGNVVFVARGADGKIASSLIAEHCEFGLESGTQVSMFELSDYATFKHARGNGLITALQVFAISTLRGLFGNNAIIYSEDRAPWLAVNKSSAQAGMECAGTLLYHCNLLSDRSIQYASTLESLNVWYAPPVGK